MEGYKLSLNPFPNMNDCAAAQVNKFDDGGVMVEEYDYGRILRLSADGEVRWSYVNRASDGRVYQLGRSRWLDAEYGAAVVQSLAACLTNPS